MANRGNLAAVFIVAALTLLVGGTGLYLGFSAPRGPQTGPPRPKQPATGPILYEMRSIRSEPDRIRFEWARIDGARRYRVAVFSPAGDSLFASPELFMNAWVIPADLRAQLKSRSSYRWTVTVLFDGKASRTSELAAFATQ